MKIVYGQQMASMSGYVVYDTCLSEVINIPCNYPQLGSCNPRAIERELANNERDRYSIRTVRLVGMCSLKVLW